MPTHRHVFTSESVTEGHPDKIADQISDAVLDAILLEDPSARVACETLVTTGMAVVAGEISPSTPLPTPPTLRGGGSPLGAHRADPASAPPAPSRPPHIPPPPPPPSPSRHSAH